MNNKLSKFDLSGKVALITGAAGLLGYQHALALLENNATVVLTDVNFLRLVEIKQEFDNVFKDKSLIMKMDLREISSIDAVYKELNKLGLSVNILINNAAVNPKFEAGAGLSETSRLENFPLETWENQITIGLTGAFLTSKVFGSAMATSGGGVILNIASDLSVIAPDQRLYKKTGIQSNQQPVKPVSYSVVKAGLIGLTLYLSTYWADKGVRCNALSPGGVFTDQDSDFVTELESRIPLGRMAKVDEYKETILYLCSNASSYMNGQNIIIDGGRSAW